MDTCYFIRALFLHSNVYFILSFLGDQKVSMPGTNTRSSRAETHSDNSTHFTVGALLGALLILLTALLLTGLFLRCVAARRIGRRRHCHTQQASEGSNEGEEVNANEGAENLVKDRHKGSLLVTTSSGGGGVSSLGGRNISSSGNVVFLPPPPLMLHEIGDEEGGVAATMLQRIPPGMIFLDKTHKIQHMDINKGTVFS